MRAKMRGAAGKIEDGATVEIVTKAEADANTEPASRGSESPEYTVRDEGGREETVNTRDFQMLA
jgi:hypothetical protein